MEVANKTCYLTQPPCTDTGPTSPIADPLKPGFWQGQQSDCCSVIYTDTGPTSPIADPLKLGFWQEQQLDCCSIIDMTRSADELGSPALEVYTKEMILIRKRVTHQWQLYYLERQHCMLTSQSLVISGASLSNTLVPICY